MLPLHRSDPRSVGGIALIGRIAVGGMGVVYLGRFADGTMAAVKTLRPDLRDDPAHRLRFAREIRHLAAVRGPFLPETFQCGHASAPQFVALRYLPGRDLRDTIDERAALAPDEIRAVAAAIADSLARLHSNGVVHRDVTAANVRLGPPGPVLMDLGIATHAEATALTSANTCVGTPAWMSPERLSGRDPDGAPSDIWSWGLVVAYSAGGVHPFGVGPPAALAYRVVHETPRLPPLPPDLAPWVRQALAHDAAARPSARDIVAALVPDFDVETYVRDRWGRFSSPEVTTASGDAETIVLPRHLEQTAVHPAARDAVAGQPRRRRLRTPALVLVTTLVAVLGAAGLLHASASDPTSPSPTRGATGIAAPRVAQPAGPATRAPRPTSSPTPARTTAPALPTAATPSPIRIPPTRAQTPRGAPPRHGKHAEHAKGHGHGHTP